GLALASPIAIDRKAKSRALDQVVRQGRDRLAMGRWIVIFPEGTRMPPCKVGKFASSGSLLAKKTGSHVVPVAHNAGQFWGKGKFLKKPGVIDVVVGESIDTSEMTAREITATVENWMREQMAQMPGCDEKSV
ncbi:MAG: 1-acyl-sn-glycerol-3-phosphate acyltransferase, partial [Gammaproteobacteria bacterium]